LTNGSTNLLDAYGVPLLDIDGNPIPDIGNPKPDIGNPILDIGNPIPDIGNPIPDIGNEIPDIGNEIPDIGNPIFIRDSDGNPIRIVDSAKDLFLAIGGGDGSDHLRNGDYGFNSDNFGGDRNITGAIMGFSGDDVLYSDNLHNPMLMGSSGNDSYIIENDVDSSNVNFTQVVEHGGDDNDSVISYVNDWAFALDIDAAHLVLFDSTQEEIIVFWDYYVPDARIENFWFDFDGDGINEHYSFDEFTTKVQGDDFWGGSLSPEALGTSRTTMDDLTQAIAEATTLSDRIESYRIATDEKALSIARLYQTAFDRTPDLAGLNTWIDHWETSQFSIGQIAEAFYNSAEFTALYGNPSDSDYITQLYVNVLNREPDSAGAASWLNHLTSGQSRAWVMEQFSESLENKINTEPRLGELADVEYINGVWVKDGYWELPGAVGSSTPDTPAPVEAPDTIEQGEALSIARLYQTAFDRTPDLPGLNYWVDEWETSDMSLQQIAENFYNSEEFSESYGNLSDTDFITQLYQNVLDRAPDVGGAANWLNYLTVSEAETFTERAEVMIHFSESAENVNNTELQLSGLTETTLGSGEWIL